MRRPRVAEDALEALPLPVQLPPRIRVLRVLPAQSLDIGLLAGLTPDEPGCKQGLGGTTGKGGHLRRAKQEALDPNEVNWSTDFLRRRPASSGTKLEDPHPLDGAVVGTATGGKAGPAGVDRRPPRVDLAALLGPDALTMLMAGDRRT